MQVKKFEAKSMKDALELVKTHLGPEAIILSAKEAHRGFGLMGEKSVEVTAAVSEETLRRKKIAESKLREDLREQYHQIPAAKQKQFINKVFREKVAVTAGGAVERVSNEVRSQYDGIRYVDIPDEKSDASRERGRERVRRAAERARSASGDVFREGPTVNRRATDVMTIAGQNAEITNLENQVRELKQLIERFQKVPQVQMTLHPGAEQGLPFEFSGMYQRLTSQGLQPQLVTGMLKKAQREIDPEQAKKPAMIDAWVVRKILNTVEVSKDPLRGRYHVFMGCTGQGKTTTLVKLASHLILKQKKKIAIISLDTLKVGAADQLRIYAQILNVPFAVVRNRDEWRVAEEKLKGVHHILVDCPGLNLQSMEEVEWLKSVLPPAEFNRSLHYVQSVLARDEETIDIASRYQMIGFHDVIFTRLDESSRQGLLLNFQEQFKVPIHSFGMGPRIPEDFELASKERIVDFIFKLSKVSKKESQYE